MTRAQLSALRKKHFQDGVIYACGVLIDVWDNTVAAAEILGAAGIDRARLQRAEPYDAKYCRKALREKP